MKALFYLIICLLTSCVSTHNRLEGLDYSSRLIEKAIRKSIPVKMKFIDEGRRELETQYFVRYGRQLKEARYEKIQARAKIKILGTSRPYHVQVEVPVYRAQAPRSVNKQFIEVGQDDRIAKIILARLKAYLTQSREESELIDGFRVF